MSHSRRGERDQLSETQLQLILDAMELSGVTLPCPRCGNEDFELLKSLSFSRTYSDFRTSQPSSSGIPAAVTICHQCGFISEHALGSLGIIDELIALYSQEDIDGE